MSAPTSSSSNYIPSGGTLFGHPTGLFALFFAEMWERFSYYGMRALLVLYMSKGFLEYNDTEAYRVYGAYTALVYMTPFFGGMIADRLIGARRAVVLGGLFMACGHLLMTVEAELAFYVALALLIVGNGFFKPNISTIVGSLYPQGSPERDSGFTIFYMGINLGAAMAPLLCGYVGETYGWHFGFGLATVGMLVGLAVFIVPTLVARILILTGAVSTAIAMVWLQDTLLLWVVNGFVASALLLSGVISFVALGRAGLPAGAGAPPDPGLLNRRFNGFSLEWVVYGCALLVVPIGATLVWSNREVTLIPKGVLEGLAESGSAIVRLMGTLAGEISTPTGLILFVTGAVALGYIVYSAFQSTKVEAQRLAVVVVLMFFSMLFWAFFEQAGSSINNFTDRNVDRVRETQTLAATDVGKTQWIRLSQEQLGHANGDRMMTIDQLDHRRERRTVDLVWTFDGDDVGMGITPVQFETRTVTKEDLDQELIIRLTDAQIGRMNEAYQVSEETLADARRAHRLEVVWKVDTEQVGMDVELPTAGSPRKVTKEDIGETLWIRLGADQVGHVNDGRELTAKQLEGARATGVLDVDWTFESEDLGTSITPVTFQKRAVRADEVGLDLVIRLSEGQLGRTNGIHRLTAEALAAATTANELEVVWRVDADHVGMTVDIPHADGTGEIPASTFQSANPIFIVLFGLIFSMTWTWLGRRGVEPNTPVKFAMGLAQLGLGFGALYYGSMMCTDRGMVGMSWLLVGYLLHTTGELCLSPVGLSMVTKLSPARLVSTVMGAWFLATAFSSFLSSVIAVFTGVGETAGSEGMIPPPIDTVHLYGSVFGTIGIAAGISSIVLLALSPVLVKWMNGIK